MDRCYYDKHEIRESKKKGSQMKNLILMAGLLAVLLLANGCGSKKNEGAEQTAAQSKTDAVAVKEVETTVTEAASPEMKLDGAAEAVKEPEKTVQPVDPDAVVVTVNGQKLTEKEVSDETEKVVEMQKKRMPPGMELPDTMKQQIRKSVVDMKVEQTLLNQQVKKEGIEISDEQVLGEIQKIADQQGLTMEQLKEDIARSGTTLEDAKGQIRYQMQIGALMKLKNPDSVVTEADARKSFTTKIRSISKPLNRFEPAIFSAASAASPKTNILPSLKKSRRPRPVLKPAKHLKALPKMFRHARPAHRAAIWDFSEREQWTRRLKWPPLNWRLARPAESSNPVLAITSLR